MMIGAHGLSRWLNILLCSIGTDEARHKTDRSSVLASNRAQA